MNKNKQIASVLSKMSEAYKDMAFNIELLRDILLKPEKVQAVNSKKNARCDHCGVNGRLPNCNHCSDCEKNARTEAINDGCNQAVDKANKADEEDFYNLQEIGRNTKTIFYKRTSGQDSGSIVSDDCKTGERRDHKYVATTSLYHQLCLVSNDQSGIGYINRVVRPSIKQRVKDWNVYHGDALSDRLSRYCRPSWTNGEELKNHCAVYLVDRSLFLFLDYK